MKVDNKSEPSNLRTDLEGAQAVRTPRSQELFDICEQFQKDHDFRPQGPGMFVYGMALLLGSSLVRRISNLVSLVGIPEFYPAQRNYPVLNSLGDSVERFKPQIWTMNENQSQDASLKPRQLRYEILPPTTEQNCYSVIYYFQMETEKVPVSWFSKIYDWLRPVLYGSKKDWEAIQVDIDKDTQQPVALSFETSNYTNNPESFYAMSSRDMHLFCQVSKKSDGTWEKMIQQKNGKIQKNRVENPFKNDGKPQVALVSWNGSLDLCDQVSQNSNLKLYSCGDLETRFLDIDTYRREGMDLRTTWLMSRKTKEYSAQIRRIKS